MRDEEAAQAVCAEAWTALGAKAYQALLLGEAVSASERRVIKARVLRADVVMLKISHGQTSWLEHLSLFYAKALEVAYEPFEKLRSLKYWALGKVLAFWGGSLTSSHVVSC